MGQQQPLALCNQAISPTLFRLFKWLMYLVT
jgi:hypothetical protein